MLEQAKQSSGLSPAVHFVPLGCSSRPESFRGSVPQTACQQKKRAAKKNGSSFFCRLRSQSPHVPYLRSLGLLHPQYRFIPLRSASYAPLHSSSIMYAAPSSFSGCSFAQPSRRRPSVALNQGKPPKNGG